MKLIAPRRAPIVGTGREWAITPGRRRRRRGSHTSPWWALLFVGPTFAGLAVFYLYPTVRTLWISLNDMGPFGNATFVWFDNYAKLFADDVFITSLRNTFVYSLIVLLGIPIATVIAAMLNTPGLRARGVYRTLFFLPVVTLPAVVAIVWRLIYNGDYGILNQVLGFLGIKGTSWVTDPHTALAAISVVGIWMGLGTNIVILLAGLQSIPDTAFEAAKIDGAGPIRTFFSITVPLLSPSIFIVSVIGLIGSLQVFDIVYLMLGSDANPVKPEVRSVVYTFYQFGFGRNQYGYAAAIGFALMVIVLILTAVQFRLQKRWVHYE